MTMEEQDNEENMLNNTHLPKPKSPISPTFFPSLTKTNCLHKGRREKVDHAQCHGLRRKRKDGGCCKKDTRMKMDGQIGGDDVIDGVDGANDEIVGVERKIKALQKIVPGGEYLGPDRLFEETADYILSLQVQVTALKMLASYFEGLEKEKTKVGA
ncbi:transcription factor PAR2-like [Magnolia sinica]|uniref:transcription factor PAR2-like n=1 Tax=Magnolia sinica TaxID=86752 RepID=UPI0026581273|nr:transcription factor PAR2-like [Magnolia sinica]